MAKNDDIFRTFQDNIAQNPSLAEGSAKEKAAYWYGVLCCLHEVERDDLVISIADKLGVRAWRIVELAKAKVAK